MTASSGTAGTAEPEGVISGALLREIRRRLKLRQSQLGEQLLTDTNTYRSWETGRRALGHVPIQRLRILSQRLIRLGAKPELVRLLETAIDVETSIAQILSTQQGSSDHPLATWVQTRTWHDLLAWAVAGQTPRALVNGADVPRPRLSVADRELLLDRLRAAAEQTKARTDAVSTLLRRQVYFVASWDRSSSGRDWLIGMERRELAQLRDVDGWTPTWVAGRSLAVAKANAGDPGYLRHFIARQLRGDEQEIANLNYWANWAGEDARPALSDEFMRGPDLGQWRGTVLLRQLTDGLKPATAYVDLTAHTVWALIERRPWLLDDDPQLTELLRVRAGQLLEQPERLSNQAVRELDRIFHVARIRRHP